MIQRRKYYWMDEIVQSHNIIHKRNIGVQDTRQTCKHIEMHNVTTCLLFDFLVSMKKTDHLLTF